MCIRDSLHTGDIIAELAFLNAVGKADRFSAVYSKRPGVDVYKRQELYKSGVPSMYGDKLSGFVNLMLKDGNVKQHHQSLSIGPIIDVYKRQNLDYSLT